MFTGIVEEMGKVIKVEKGAKSSKLTIGGDKIFSDLKIGDSVAVNGVLPDSYKFHYWGIYSRCYE